MFGGERHHPPHELRATLVAMTFEDDPLDELRALLSNPDCEWLHLFLGVSRFAPDGMPAPELIDAFMKHHRLTTGWRQPLSLARLPAVDRLTAARYLATVLQRELAYDTERLPAETARRAATLFLAPFGPAATFHPSISVTPDLLAAREQNRPTSFSVLTGIFGSTLEEGLFAIDSAGCVGAVFVGDED